MIIDRLQMIGSYRGVSRELDRAIDALEGIDPAALSAGRHHIDGDQLFMTRSTLELADEASLQFEWHRNYLDVQILLSEKERIVWLPVNPDEPPGVYLPDRDVAFFDNGAGMSFVLEAGMFVIFFPWDGHKPRCRTGVSETIEKLVVKIRLNNS